MFEGTRRFFSENGDPQTLRVFGVVAVCAFVVLPLLGALKEDFSGAVGATLVLEGAFGALYVLFCANNRVYANHPATKLAAANAEAAAKRLSGPTADSEGCTVAASRG